MRRIPLIAVLFLLSLSVMKGQEQPDMRWSADLRFTPEGGSEVVLHGVSSRPIDHISGQIDWMACEGESCFMPDQASFEAQAGGAGMAEPFGEVGVETTVTPASGSMAGGAAVPAPDTDKSLLIVLLEAFLWGIAMLLTPCVFPMVPLTVSYFLKSSGNVSDSRRKALSYGVFIVLLYTLPVVVLALSVRLSGGGASGIDIFNRLATHWLPNLLFFAVFMVFALSLLGAFELRLPSSWVNGADRKSDRGGLAGTFFMALTLVLVSFSCTAPIVGTVLVRSSVGEPLWTPVLAMLVFSTAFALPFVVLAFFPALLSRIPKSGEWLVTVRRSLGFIELALGLKFLSVADQAYHWNILPRELYLALWIVIFTLLGLYIAGVLRFRDEGGRRGNGISLKRLFVVIIDFAFVLYMVQGLWGAPLAALSGYLPPGGALFSCTSLDEALERAAVSGKPVFVKISGYACVNCREMDARVLSDSRVAEILERDYETVVLYVDDKTPLPPEKRRVTSSGRELDTVGKLNSYIALTRFGTASQPSYVILSPSGEAVSPVKGYDLDVGRFIKFIRK